MCRASRNAHFRVGFVILHAACFVYLELWPTVGRFQVSDIVEDSTDWQHWAAKPLVDFLCLRVISLDNLVSLSKMTFHDQSG